MKVCPIEQIHLRSCATLFQAVFNEAPWNENWPTMATLTRLEEIYRTPGFYGLAAEAEGQGMVGFVMGYTEQWQEQKHFYLKEMCVATQEQRRGVGAEIMQRLEQGLVAMDVEKIYLLTARGSSAEAFYQKCGFYISPKMIMMAKYLGC